MATTKSMKIQAEIDKVKAKISEQQARLKELEQKKLEAENSEIVDIVRGMSIPLAELPLLFEKLKGGGALGQSVPKYVTCRQKWRLFSWPGIPRRKGGSMQFFTSAIDTLQTLVVALGAGLGVWGVVNLLEGYGSDNPGSKSQGMKQLMAGGGIILLGTTLIPLLSGLF